MEPNKLVAEAEKYLGEALKQGDLRQMAEKGHLAATLVADALIVSKGYEKPSSLYRRQDILEKISKDLAKEYTFAVDTLHRRCFYDGICEPERVKNRIEDVSQFIKNVKKLIQASKNNRP